MSTNMLMEMVDVKKRKLELIKEMYAVEKEINSFLSRFNTLLEYQISDLTEKLTKFHADVDMMLDDRLDVKEELNMLEGIFSDEIESLEAGNDLEVLETLQDILSKKIEKIKAGQKAEN